MEKIIGIIFGKKNTPWQRIDADGNAIDVAAGEFDAHPVYAGIQGETIDGQQMVRVPAFYYRAGAVRAGENQLGVEVVNSWPNRLIGDAGLPPDQRQTSRSSPAIRR